MSETIDVKCLCGGVAFIVTGTKKATVLCHCADCKAFTGSAFAYNCQLVNAKIEYKTSADLISAYTSKESVRSGNAIVRRFCRKCGSSLYLAPASVPDMVIVALGTTEVTDPPKVELFKKDRCAWQKSVSDSKL